MDIKHKLITIFFKNCFVYLQTGGDDGYYDCEEIPFFEIGSVHYDEYLVNIKLPYARHSNERIGLVTEINFVVSKRSFIHFTPESSIKVMRAKEMITNSRSS